MRIGYYWLYAIFLSKTYGQIISSLSYGYVSDLSNGKLYSGSRDGTICVWDISSDTILSDLNHIARLSDHNDCVTSLVISNGKLYSGSRDGTICIWVISSYTISSDLTPIARLSDHI